MPTFSASGSRIGGRREEKMTEARVDLANEINFAPGDDIVKDTNPLFWVIMSLISPHSLGCKT